MIVGTITFTFQGKANEWYVFDVTNAQLIDTETGDAVPVDEKDIKELSHKLRMIAKKSFGEDEQTDNEQTDNEQTDNEQKKAFMLFLSNNLAELESHLKYDPDLTKESKGYIKALLDVFYLGEKE